MIKILDFFDELIKNDSTTRRKGWIKERIREELSKKTIRVADIETLEAILQDPQILQDILPSRIGPIK